jgi:solute carrier family 25 protein 42
VFRSTVRENGLKALYRGYAPAMLGVIPYAGVSFYTFETLKHAFVGKFAPLGDRLMIPCQKLKNSILTDSVVRLSHDVPARKQRNPNAIEKMCCGAVAGLMGQSASYPLDIVRRRMQTADIINFECRTVLGTLAKVYR